MSAHELDETLVIGEIDPREIRQVRTFYPLLRDERLDLTLRELKRIYAKRHQSETYDDNF